MNDIPIIDNYCQLEINLVINLHTICLICITSIRILIERKKNKPFTILPLDMEGNSECRVKTNLSII